MLDDLRDRVVELEQLDLRLQSCLADVRRAHELAQAELAAGAREDMNLRPLGAVGPPNGNVTKSIRAEEIRDAVVKLKHFTMSELAAELGCSTAKAHTHLRKVEHLVREDGRLGSTKLWAYIEPDGPGSAFVAQQRLRPMPEVHAGDLATGRNGDVKQSLLGGIPNKEIKEAVRQAIAEGWELVPSSGKHPFKLRRGGQSIPISHTPTNAGHAARAIRRQIRTS